jgi:hypothetical protein
MLASLKKQLERLKESSMRKLLKQAKPWLDAGVDVPRGVHPLIDSIKANVNTEWVDKATKGIGGIFQFQDKRT